MNGRGLGIRRGRGGRELGSKGKVYAKLQVTDKNMIIKTFYSLLKRK